MLARRHAAPFFKHHLGRAAEPTDEADDPLWHASCRPAASGASRAATLDAYFGGAGNCRASPRFAGTGGRTLSAGR